MTKEVNMDKAFTKKQQPPKTGRYNVAQQELYIEVGGTRLISYQEGKQRIQDLRPTQILVQVPEITHDEGYVSLDDLVQAYLLHNDYI